MNLLTLIPFLNENKNDIKIHFARGGNRPEEALNAFLEGHFKDWQERQKNKNFECLYVLSLIRLNNIEWLFGDNMK